MNRRNFLRAAILGTTVMAVAPQLLWTPTKKIFLPPVGGWAGPKFQYKYYSVNITLSLEDIKILREGPKASFALINERMVNTYLCQSDNRALCEFLRS